MKNIEIPQWLKIITIFLVVKYIFITYHPIEELFKAIEGTVWETVKEWVELSIGIAAYLLGFFFLCFCIKNGTPYSYKRGYKF